ncbi:MAG: SRPBCC family protein [Anaerolineae bacterium]|nr:SRPBCC family protein [Anaerolineae bacterium]
MIVVDKVHVVHAPVSQVYHQWTSFESFPRFMQGVVDVERIDNMLLHWRASYSVSIEDWYAEITEVQRDRCVAWRALGSRRHHVRVSFTPLSAGTTRVLLHLEYEPNDILEDCGPMLGAVERRVEGDLMRFKELMEGRGWKIGTKTRAVSERAN